MGALKPQLLQPTHPKLAILGNMKGFISSILLVASATQSTYCAPSDSSSDTRGFFGGQRPVGGYRPVGGTVGGFNTGVSRGLVGGVIPVVGGVSPPIINPPSVGGGVIPPSGSVCQFWCNRGGQYVCCENSQQAHPGRCPVPRPQCPPVRSGFQGPQSCNLDIDCPYQNKCCYDTCLRERVCKPALYY